ncbi:MAG: hypothetical protein J6X44_10240 [Thermoguttaceae bacterium]|nr:hypothetical protein [Thermoguttaceae bacterium]
MSRRFPLIFLSYYLLFASGLFKDSKKKDSIVQERLGVKPGAYWLANAFAAFVVLTVVFGMIWFFDRIYNNGGFRPYVHNGAIFAWLFGTSVWCASFKVSRLVVGAVTFVVSFLTGSCITLAYGFVGPLFVGIRYSDLEFLLIELILAFVFSFASYKIVSGRALNRKRPWSVTIPTIILAAMATFLMCLKFN